MLGGKYEVILKKPENDMIEEGEYSRYLIKMALIDDVGESIDDTNIKNDRLIKQREMLLENQNIINHNPPKTSVKFKKKLSITCLKKKK